MRSDLMEVTDNSPQSFTTTFLVVKYIWLLYMLQSHT